ncbi:MAG TPA: futalosine hydrolase [Planctomycetota bacterium]|nr:futalosine hydrolase [Planctomycetota bacterium]
MSGTGASHGGVPIGDFVLVCASALENFDREGRVHVLGVGKTAAAMRLPTVLRSVPTARAVLLFGVAGAFPDRHRTTPAPARLGQVCVVASDRFGDEGVETPTGFQAIEQGAARLYANEAGDRILGGPAAFPANPRMAQQASAMLRVPLVRGVTVSTCSGTEATSQRMSQRSGADIETMEGAAVAYVCRQLEVPLLHVRAISNWTGDRDRGEWNLGAAVDAVGQAVRRLVQGPA